MEAKKMKCYCDIRDVKSKVLRYLKKPIVDVNGCTAGANKCPGKCWNEGRKALKKQSVLNKMCLRYKKTIPRSKGMKLFGYVKVEKCNIRPKYYDYKKKLCCYYTAKRKYGYLC